MADIRTTADMLVEYGLSSMPGRLLVEPRSR
jgi:hypothetical protein